MLRPRGRRADDAWLLLCRLDVPTGCAQIAQWCSARKVWGSRGWGQCLWLTILLTFTGSGNSPKATGAGAALARRPGADRGGEVVASSLETVAGLATDPGWL